MLQLTRKHDHITSFSSFKTAMKASWGTSTLPIDFILFFPSAWLETDNNTIMSNLRYESELKQLHISNFTFLRCK